MLPISRKLLCSMHLDCSLPRFHCFNINSTMSARVVIRIKPFKSCHKHKAFVINVLANLGILVKTKINDNNNHAGKSLS